MTGFARTEGGVGEERWSWELKSVNGRGLDLRFRMPPQFDSVEVIARQAITRRFSRGSITIRLNFSSGVQGPHLKVNRDVLDQLLDLSQALSMDRIKPPRIDALLAIKGVVEVVEFEQEGSRDETDRAVLKGFDEALDLLETSREQEGSRLLDRLSEHLNEIDNLTSRIRSSDSARPDALKDRLNRYLAGLSDIVLPIPEERIAQEVALLLVKTDVNEELDRLSVHIQQARQLLVDNGPVGRKFDFLSQEFNREANTLCAKVSDMQNKRIGLELKTIIDRLREHVQNVE